MTGEPRCVGFRFGTITEYHEHDIYESFGFSKAPWEYHLVDGNYAYQLVNHFSFWLVVVIHS